MSAKTCSVHIDEFIVSLRTWNDAENVGSIIRSLADSTDEWIEKSQLKRLRKFICKYCPYVMDDMEIMTGITENWRLEDIVYILKKQKIAGKEFITKLTSYVSNEMVDICSEESLKIVQKMKNKFDFENLKDIILLMMMQKSCKFGWEFVDAWTNDKLEELIKTIVGDEQFGDVSNGADGGLFEIFPYMKDKIDIREVMNHEESEDSEGSLVDFIENDIEDSQKESESSSDDFQKESDESESESESESGSVEEIEIVEKGEKRSKESVKAEKKRRIMISSDSDS